MDRYDEIAEGVEELIDSEAEDNVDVTAVELLEISKEEIGLDVEVDIFALVESRLLELLVANEGEDPLDVRTLDIVVPVILFEIDNVIEDVRLLDVEEEFEIAVLV